MKARTLCALSTFFSIIGTLPAQASDNDGFDANAGADDYVVKAQGTTAPDAPGVASNGTADATEPPPKPPCSEVPGGMPCTEVRICTASDASPTGYMAVIFSAADTGNGTRQTVLEPCRPDEAATAVNLPALVLSAFQRVPLPEPRLAIQPPKGKTLVGLETIFSTEAAPFTRTLNLLGQSVQLRIHASSYAWGHGDGTTQTTDWSGRPWERGIPLDRYITHIYEDTGQVSLSVRVIWSADYRVGNGPWQPVNGTVERTSPPTALQIIEAEPQLVAP